MAPDEGPHIRQARGVRVVGVGVVRWLTTTPRHRGVVGAEGQLWAAAAAMQMGRAATAEANKSRQHGVQRQVPKAGIESQHAAAAFSHSTLQNHTTVFVRPVFMFESLTHKWAVAVFLYLFCLFSSFYGQACESTLWCWTRPPLGPATLRCCCCCGGCCRCFRALYYCRLSGGGGRPVYRPRLLCGVG